MTVNTEIGHHVSPFCPRAHCWRTSADNLAARRTSECGSCQGLSTKGKFLKRETCVRDISETLDLAFFFVTYIHIYYIHILYTYIFALERAKRRDGEAARISERIDRVSPSLPLYRPLLEFGTEKRVCVHTFPGWRHRVGTTVGMADPLLAERGQSRRFDPRPASHSVISVWSARYVRVVPRASRFLLLSFRFFFSFSSIGFLLLCRSPFPPPGGNSHVWGTWAK